MHDFNRMKSGSWYIAGGPEIVQQHEKNRSIMKRFNDLANTDMAQGEAILAEALAPGSGIPETFAPLHLEYGINTTFGTGCFMNFNCIIVDVAPITVGNNTLFGPGCQLITAEHPVNDVEMRVKGWERARPIAIGDDCWFGAGAMVMPGVTIGHRCVIAAGAVVTKDIPDDSLVMGVPGKVTRTLNQPGDALERDELEPGEY
ncbi:sugar O-acetyltransferase [Corynebacterium sp. S7]